MIIVAGALYVEAAARSAYLAGCAAVVEAARAAPGCLDFTLSADLLDPSRINVFERWEAREPLTAFRGSGPSGEQRATLERIDVAEYAVSLE